MRDTAWGTGVTAAVMYTRYYGLKEKPFNITPDSHFLYRGRQHRDALGHLRYGIRERKGFILVTGEVGTGKTTLCRALIREIESEAEVGFIYNTFLSAKELLRAVNDDLTGGSAGNTKKELVDDLNRFLLEMHAAGRDVVLIIDECQNLAASVLEQIRMLSNLETEKHKLLQIVLVGQPEIIGKLEREGLRQLAQRISVSYHLRPLDEKETARYIHHRLAVAGCGTGEPSARTGRKPPVRFSRAALKRIFAYSGGVPRKINIVCDRALLVGYVRGRKKMTDGIVRQAIGEIRGAAARKSRRLRARRRRRVAAAVLAASGALALALVAGRRYARIGTWWRRASGEESGAFRMAAAGLPGAVVAKGEPEDEARGRSEPASARRKARPDPSSAAASRLVTMWGRKAGGDLAHGGVRRSFSELAKIFGMKAVSCWADPAFLREVDIPCIVQVRAPQGGDRIPLVLERVTTDSAVLTDPEGAGRELKDAELAEALAGRVVYFCPPGAVLNHLLAAGDEGKEVEMLQRDLEKLGVFTARADGRYGRETEEAVRRLQKEHGLAPDGIVGRNESILIRSLRAAAGVPRLKRAGEG